MEKIDLAALIARHTDQAKAPGGIIAQAENSVRKARAAKRKQATDRLHQTKRALADARKEAIKSDGKIVSELLGSIGSMIPDVCARMSGPGNGYRIVLALCKTDDGQGNHSAQIMRNGKTLTRYSEHSLREMEKNREFKSSKLEQELISQGVRCGTREDLLGEIKRLKDIIQKMERVRAAEEQLEESDDPLRG